MICSFNCLIFLAVCLNISTVINIQILTNSNLQTQSYKFTCHIAAFLCGFDHRDAWNLHINIIWSKHSTDFKELSPCSEWYPLKGTNTVELVHFDTWVFRHPGHLTKIYGPKVFLLTKIKPEYSNILYNLKQVLCVSD